MNLRDLILPVSVGIIVVGAGAWILWHFLSADARRERRRRRSNTRVTSTANRPMVRFSVKTKKERRK